MRRKQRLAILGATGSIGRQTIDVVSSYRDFYEVEYISAHNSWKELAELAKKVNANTAIITNDALYDNLQNELKNTDIKAFAGEESLLQEIRNNSNVDTYIIGISGFAGLRPTIEALKSTKKKVALANKESLVVGGDFIKKLAKQHKSIIMPIDSEHSAIFQCIIGEFTNPSRLIITASGGALRDVPIEDLQYATPKQVLNHPSWDMGPRVTVDSATMLNKGFEIIEAHHLFDLPWNKIDVVIHPESIIHSMVEFADGAIKAQLGIPDMRIPIQYALTCPFRYPIKNEPKFYNPLLQPLTFREVDFNRYPCLSLAYNCMKEGGSSTTVLNAAGEIAVQRFLKEDIKYLDISRIIEKSLNHFPTEKITDFDQIIDIDRQVRLFASQA